jgi:hypothetical protein
MVDIQEWGYGDGRGWDEKERSQGDECGARSKLKGATGSGGGPALP